MLTGKDIIIHWHRRWRNNLLVAHALKAMGLGFVVGMIGYRCGYSWLWGMPTGMIAFVLWLAIDRSWQLPLREVTRFINAHYPAMEASSNLLLQPSESLNALQRMQVAKAEATIRSMEVPAQFYTRIKRSLVYFFACLLLTFIIAFIPFRYPGFGAGTSGIKVTGKDHPAVVPMPAMVSSVNIEISPPPYTGHAKRRQSVFNLQVEQGGAVEWRIYAPATVHRMELKFSDSSSLKLTRQSAGDLWTSRRMIRQPGFYQVVVNDSLSTLYRIEMISDLPPVIHMISPKPYVTIDYGQPPAIRVQSAISDDYGLSAAVLAATISSGNGEAVTFKEQQINFPGFTPGSHEQTLSREISLSALGLRPGDEMYYFIRARDNQGQETRSDVYVASLADTTGLMSIEGMATGISLVPEYFRSQRQIIIETESLLKSRDSMPLQAFNNKSNDLGIDQKLLRLRYGKFLGEENEDGADEHHESPTTEAHNDARDFGNEKVIRDQYTHTHDNAEDASFFEPALKAQLKATLAEMWKSELQLRTYKPAAALPFEYKALRLLKDLQQKSRVYVAKTNAKTTPLKPENRLTGELDKVTEPKINRFANAKPDPAVSLRNALASIERLKEGNVIDVSQWDNVKSATQVLGERAAAAPAVYLDAYSIMNRVLEARLKNTRLSSADLLRAQKALQQLTPKTEPLPQAAAEPVAPSLSDNYFRNVNRLSR